MFDWQEMLMNVLYVVLMAAIPVMTTYIVKFFRSLFTKMETETDQLVIKNTIEATMKLIVDAVMTTSQTYVDSLKAEGKFDEEAQSNAFELTKNTVLELLSEETENILSSIYKDLDLWLDTQIEATVRSTKLTDKK